MKNCTILLYVCFFNTIFSAESALPEDILTFYFKDRRKNCNCPIDTVIFTPNSDTSSILRLYPDRVEVESVSQFPTTPVDAEELDSLFRIGVESKIPLSEDFWEKNKFKCYIKAIYGWVISKKKNTYLDSTLELPNGTKGQLHFPPVNMIQIIFYSSPCTEFDRLYPYRK